MTVQPVGKWITLVGNLIGVLCYSLFATGLAKPVLDFPHGVWFAALFVGVVCYIAAAYDLGRAAR